MKSSVLGVGTELTDGQVINRNAAWISEKLKPLGPRTALHLTVPDDREAILEGLDLCARHSDLIFVTGGLGPTSDDFTRDLIAQWADRPTEFHEPSWLAVRQRLESRGFAVQEFQKQQCFFPRGAVILANAEGTANGFRLRARDKDLIVLPGPPREVAAIWRDHLHAWLGERCAGLDPLVTKSWDTIGLGESQIAAMADPLFTGSSVEVGYRVHLPYVELKLTLPRSELDAHRELFARVDRALGDAAVLRDGADLTDDFARLMAERDFRVVDEVTGAFLVNRLQSAIPKLRGRWSFASWGECAPGETALWIRPVDEHTARVGLRRNAQIRETRIEAPMKSPLMSERRRQYFAEMALLFWTREFADGH